MPNIRKRVILLYRVVGVIAIIINAGAFFVPAAFAASATEDLRTQEESPDKLDETVLNNELRQYEVLYARGHFDELIARANKYIGDPYHPNEDLDEVDWQKQIKNEPMLKWVYMWRATAVMAIGQYDLAESDFTIVKTSIEKDVLKKMSYMYLFNGATFYSKKVLDDYLKLYQATNKGRDLINKKEDKGKDEKADKKDLPKVIKSVPDIDKSLREIAKYKRLRPTKMHEVTNGDDVVFRVYYDEDSAATRIILDALYPAYQVNDRLLQTYLSEIPVYIFSTRAEIKQFMGKGYTAWALAMADKDGLFLCLRDEEGGSILQRASQEYLRGTIAHELNHTLVRRTMGNVTLPAWLTEGLADVAKDMLFQANKQLSDYSFAIAFAAGAIIPPQQLESSDYFYKTAGKVVQSREQASRMGLRILTADPYAQGTFMMRYLLSNMDEGSLPDFLNTVREERNFKHAFEDYFDASLPEFYESWIQAVRAANS